MVSRFAWCGTKFSLWTEKFPQENNHVIRSRCQQRRLNSSVLLFKCDVQGALPFGTAGSLVSKCICLLTNNQKKTPVFVSSCFIFQKRWIWDSGRRQGCRRSRSGARNHPFSVDRTNSLPLYWKSCILRRTSLTWINIENDGRTIGYSLERIDVVSNAGVANMNFPSN